MFNSLFNKFRKISESKKEEIEKSSPEDILKNIADDKFIIKSLLSNDLIDEDEYLTKLQILVGQENEVKKSDYSAKLSAMYKRKGLNSDGSSKIKNKKGYADTIILNEDGKFLILRRNTQDDIFPGLWGLPGGKIDAGEDPYTAACRELKEETNLDVIGANNIVLEREVETGTIYYFVGLKKPGPQTIILDNDEHYSYEWVDEQELINFDCLPDLKETILSILEVQKPQLIIPDPIDVIKIFTQAENDVKGYDLLKSQFDNNEITEDEYLDLVFKGHKGGKIGRHWKVEKKTGDVEKDSEHIKENTSDAGNAEFKENERLIKEEKLRLLEEKDSQSRKDLNKLKKINEPKIKQIITGFEKKYSIDDFKRNLNFEMQTKKLPYRITDYSKEEIGRFWNINKISGK